VAERASTRIHAAVRELHEKDLQGESMFVFANVPNCIHVHSACDIRTRM
jgi:hypothetical protein